MKIKIISTVLFLVLSNLSIAQEGWSLEKCINHAIENNLTVKQSQVSTEIARRNKIQQQMYGLPSLNGYVANGYNWGRRIDPFTNTFATDRVQSSNISLSSSYTVFNGMQNYNSIKQAGYNYESAMFDEEKIKNDISMSVALSYLKVLFSKELLATAQQQVELTQTQVDRTRKLYEAQQLTEGDLLNIQAQLAQEELVSIEAENTLLIDRITLIQLLELDVSPYEFKIEVPEFENLDELMVTESANEVYQKALTIMPQVKSAETQLMGSETYLSITRGGRSPRLTLSGSIGSGYSGANIEGTGNPVIGVDTVGFTVPSLEAVVVPTFGYEGTQTKPLSDQLNDNLNYNTNISLTIPIFNGWSVESNVSKAKLTVMQSEIQVEQVKNELEKNVTQSYADAVASLKKEKVAKKSVEALEKAFAYTQIKWEQNMIDVVEYNDSKTQLIRVQSEYLRAKYDYIFKTRVLQFYKGNSLAF